MTKRMLITRYPHNVERAYAKNMLRLTQAIADIVLYEFDTNIAPEINSRNMRFDGYLVDSIFQKSLDRIKALTLGIFTAKEKYSIASKFVRASNSTAKTQFVNQMEVAGVDPTKTEPWLNDYMDAAIAENVSYIGSIGDEYSAKTEQIILRGAKEGRSGQEIRDELVDQIGMSENKAKFIARDQVGSLFGDLTTTRHKKVGIPGFMWSDSGDNRVRPLHVEYNGKYFSYDDPNAPIPGKDYGCRCVAIPEFDESVINAAVDERKQQENEDKTTLKNAYSEVVSAAQKAPGHIEKLLSSHITEDSFEIARDNSIAYAYRPSTKKIIINPSDRSMKYYNQQEILLHESGHLLDYANFKSWENKSFQIATQIERKVANWEEISELFHQEKWASDDYFSDICSALTENKVKGYAGHAASYWKRKGSAEKEIFANLFAMLALDKQESMAMVKKQFPMVYGSFIKMIEGDLSD
ncbi:minor capsid protein [Listeria booriae]|uniref:phage head morphogenesis protein n=1 Tax=Listeria booriae TaxID=1552123 RepID=UPI00162833CA|nr:minor capsid protein [Listeria booriae]MBC2077671.1 minor capsid protein [Listeria booriae]